MERFKNSRFVLGVIFSVAVSAAAQKPAPNLPGQGPRTGFSLPAGAVTDGRLNQLFDAATQRANDVVSAPRFLARRIPHPAPIPTDRPAAARLHQELVVPIPSETPTYRRTFNSLLSSPEKTDRWDDLILKYARKYHLDARVLKSVMAAESEFNPRAVSSAGARGLMQVMPATAKDMGVPAGRLHDPEQGIKAGAAYLHLLFVLAWSIFHLKGVRYTDVPHWVLQRVIAAYHAGPKFLTRSRWFTSTRAYVRKVVLYYKSKVTDLRRPRFASVSTASRELPTFAESVAPSGTLY